MVSIMANGLAGNDVITAEGDDFTAFMEALNTVTVHLCRMIAGDGEGATKLLECSVKGAADEATAPPPITFKKWRRFISCFSILSAFLLN